MPSKVGRQHHCREENLKDMRQLKTARQKIMPQVILAATKMRMKIKVHNQDGAFVFWQTRNPEG